MRKTRFNRNAAKTIFSMWRRCLVLRRRTVVASFNSYVRSALDAYIANQERNAQRYINTALISLDDKTLANLGYNRDELKKRSGAYLI